MTTVVSKGPCKACGSSDACASYNDGTSYCFSCETYFNDQGSVIDNIEEEKEKPEESAFSYDIKGKPREIRERKISLKTVEFYGVKTIKKDGAIVQHHYPYHHPVSGELIACKTRSVRDKKFFAQGEIKQSGLFGQNKFPQGSAKFITVTEGELDALAAYEMLGSKWPVVSLKNGAGSAARDLRANEEVWKYLNSFETIVACFDLDEPGKKAATEFAKMFSPGKVSIFKGTHKDACDYKVFSTADAFKRDWWAAEKYKPDGVYYGQELIQKVLNKPEVTSFQLPWSELQRLTYGIRTSEMWVLIAGTGIGKTQVMRELAKYLFDTNPDHKIGTLFLEETAVRTCEGFAGIHANIPFHLPDTNYTEEEKLKALEETIGTERIIVYDSFAENNAERVLEIIEYMALVHGCKWILLDHLSMLVAEQENFGGKSERQALDQIAVQLRKICQELDIGILAVSHTRRPSVSISHEEGGPVRTNDIRGTGGIAQVSDMIISLQRNGQAEDEIERNTTLVRVLKNRFSGLTGPASSLLYNKDTGRLEELEQTVDVEELEDEDELFGDEDETS